MVIAAQSGDHSKAILRQARRRGDKATVAQLETTAEYTEQDLILYANLFLMCEADRKDSLSPIPITSLLACIRHFRLDDYQEDFLLLVCSVADPIVLAERRTRHGNAGPTVDANAGSVHKFARNR